MNGLYDVAIVGAGPAGSSCAAFCARAGLRVIIVERERFPREKVCGDCLNPSCWPVLDRLGLSARVRNLAHGQLHLVEFIGINGESVTVPLPRGKMAEIAVKRSLFDNLLLERALELGARVRQQCAVTAIRRTENWQITAGATQISARVLVGADGRNSTVARLSQLLPKGGRERISLQSHLHLPANFGDRVVLQLLPWGYSGQAPVNGGELNVCLVGRPSDAAALKEWAQERFEVSAAHPWRTITPLSRAPVSPTHQHLFLLGDAARVVEPFTGEGIYYALRSGELAAEAITQLTKGRELKRVAAQFEAAHRAMYRGRLWINQLARLAVLAPRTTSRLLPLAAHSPGLLRLLTSKVVAEDG